MDFDEEVPFHEWSSCEWYGHSYVNDFADEEETVPLRICTGCGDVYSE